jgi:xanthine dehydrogenase accessory factor
VYKELELWEFVLERLSRGEDVILLVVAESSGSSPGRQGYKMAVSADGELCGSIGGGIMEITLVEQAKVKSKKSKGESGDELRDQVHRKNVPDSSGMICSGKQTVIFKFLSPADQETVRRIIEALKDRQGNILSISPRSLTTLAPNENSPNFQFEKHSELDFDYKETLGPKNDLYIIGGGHCALALSELMSKMDFHISIFDDRPHLNTIKKNKFADEINTIENYDRIAEFIPSSASAYVVVMTLGYKSDAAVIRSLIDKDFIYFGVLGSKAKMATLMKELKGEGVDAKRLEQIHTPIGLPINSHTPEEIAVSIAAEIITVKNA